MISSLSGRGSLVAIEAKELLFRIHILSAGRHQAIGFVPDAQLSKWVQDLVAKVPKSAPPPAP